MNKKKMFSCNNYHEYIYVIQHALPPKNSINDR